MKKIVIVGTLGLMLLTACDVTDSGNDSKCNNDNNNCTSSTVVTHHMSVKSTKPAKSTTHSDEEHTTTTHEAPVEAHPVVEAHVSVAR